MFFTTEPSPAAMIPGTLFAHEALPFLRSRRRVPSPARRLYHNQPVLRGLLCQFVSVAASRTASSCALVKSENRCRCRLRLSVAIVASHLFRNDSSSSKTKKHSSRTGRWGFVHGQILWKTPVAGCNSFTITCVWLKNSKFVRSRGLGLYLA